MSRKLQIVVLMVAGLGALLIGIKFGSDLRPGADDMTIGQAQSSTDSADTLAAFSLLDINGVKTSSAHWPGKRLLINFWAPWCAPCREEIPLLNDAAARYASEDVVVIGIALDSLESVRRFSDEFGITYPSLIADKDAGFDLLEQYNPGAQLPFSLLVEPSGRIAQRKLGLLTPAQLTRWVFPDAQASGN